LERISRTARMKIKILTGIYVFFFAVLVILADLRGTRHLLDFVGGIPFGDKIGHFILIGIFSLLVNLSLGAKTRRSGGLNFPVGSLIVSAIVTIEEFSQLFVGGRSFDINDLLADYLGIFVFGRIARSIYRNTEN
jgi:VanZ family protein